MNPSQEERLSRHRQRLLWRIKRKYDVICSPVEVGALRFDFTRIANPDRVLDEVAAEADLRDRLNGSRTDGDQLHLPYWAELWDSATGIALHLEALKWGGSPRSISPPTPPVRPRQLSVLDLGCGMGMSGTAAAALGARVLFGDLESPALLFAQLNSLRWRRRVRTRRLNWQRDQLSERFDLIIGADILYEKAQWTYLERFWRNHLSPGGSVLLGEPGRQTGDLFVDWIRSRDWTLTLSEVPVTTRPKPIRLFHIEPATTVQSA